MSSSLIHKALCHILPKKEVSKLLHVYIRIKKNMNPLIPPQISLLFFYMDDFGIK